MHALLRFVTSRAARPRTRASGHPPLSKSPASSPTTPCARSAHWRGARTESASGALELPGANHGTAYAAGGPSPWGRRTRPFAQRARGEGSTREASAPVPRLRLDDFALKVGGGRLRRRIRGEWLHLRPDRERRGPMLGSERDRFERVPGDRSWSRERRHRHIRGKPLRLRPDHERRGPVLGLQPNHCQRVPGDCCSWSRERRRSLASSVSGTCARFTSKRTSWTSRRFPAFRTSRCSVCSKRARPTFRAYLR